jgi:hypothetical protein
MRQTGELPRIIVCSSLDSLQQKSKIKNSLKIKIIILTIFSKNANFNVRYALHFAHLFFSANLKMASYVLMFSQACLMITYIICRLWWDTTRRPAV